MTDNNSDGRANLQESIKDLHKQGSLHPADSDIQQGLKIGKGYSQKRLNPLGQSSLSGKERHREGGGRRVIAPVVISFAIGILVVVFIFRIIYAPSSDTDEIIDPYKEIGNEEQIILKEKEAEQEEGIPTEKESSGAGERIVADDIVIIPDPVLKKAIQEALDIGEQQVTREEALSLTELNDNGLNDRITDITGLSTFENLTTLELDNNQISSIKELSGLKNLTYLDLEGNQVSDISALSSLTNLTHLDLEGNQVSDISALSGLLNLTHLDLGWNGGWKTGVSDISPLSDLTNLTYLDLYDNHVRDISVLADLTNLTYLNVGANGLSDISALSGLTNLTYLGLDLNRVEDLSALSRLTNLSELVLTRNWIEDISPLSGLTNLTRLSLSGNTVIFTEEEIMEVLSGAENLTVIGF